MKVDITNSNKIASSLASRTKEYLEQELNIEVTQVHPNTNNADHLHLDHITAVIGVGGKIGLLIVFSFSQEMSDVVFKHLTGRLQIAPEDEELYRRETVAEITNIIVGTCTADWASSNERITISPPAVLESAKAIRRMDNAIFGSLQFITGSGSLNVHWVGPPDLFDKAFES